MAKQQLKWAKVKSYDSTKERANSQLDSILILVDENPTLEKYYEKLEVPKVKIHLFGSQQDSAEKTSQNTVEIAKKTASDAILED